MGHITFKTWTPASNLQSINFTQSRGVKQPQERFEQKRELDGISSEKRNVESVVAHARNIDETESRQVEVDFSPWSSTTKDSYTTWGPTASAQTANYNQSRNYSQNQTRDRIHKTSSVLLNSFDEFRVLKLQSELRPVSVTVTPYLDTTKTRIILFITMFPCSLIVLHGLLLLLTQC